MTNPDNIVRVRARLDGRASVYEANGWAQAYSQGLLSGNGVLPNTIPDMNVLVGGTPSNPDVVIAENPDGYKIALDIVGQQAIAITAPASQSRISAIVAYTDDLSLASTDSTTTGSPSSCGLIVVNGSTSANPTEPSDSTIRTAITSDGATGSQASYCVLATILVSSSTTEISSSLINKSDANISANSIDWSESPCVSTFILSGDSMPATTQHITKTTKRGTQLSIVLSGSYCYVESGADNINRARYTITYAHPTTSDNYGCAGLAANTKSYCYYTGLNDSSAVNTSAENTAESSGLSTLCQTGGTKFLFSATLDALRASSDSNYERNNVWNLMGQIISAGSPTSYTVNNEVRSATLGTIPCWYQRNASGTYYYITIEVYED